MWRATAPARGCPEPNIHMRRDCSLPEGSSPPAVGARPHQRWSAGRAEVTRARRHRYASRMDRDRSCACCAPSRRQPLSTCSSVPPRWSFMGSCGRPGWTYSSAPHLRTSNGSARCARRTRATRTSTKSPAADLLGEYPAIRYYPPTGDVYVDVLTRLANSPGSKPLTPRSRTSQASGSGSRRQRLSIHEKREQSARRTSGCRRAGERFGLDDAG